MRPYLLRSIEGFRYRTDHLGGGREYLGVGHEYLGDSREQRGEGREGWGGERDERKDSRVGIGRTGEGLGGGR